MTIEDARQIVGQSIDLPAFATPADLEPNDRERLYDGLADYIISNFDEFPRNARDWAGRRIDSPLFRTPLEEFGAADAAKSFAGEFVEQGRKILSFENRLVSTIAIFGALGFGLYLAFKADTARRVVVSS